MIKKQICPAGITDDEFALIIAEGATILAQSYVLLRPANSQCFGLVIAVIQPTAAAHTYKLQLGRSVGTGTATANAAATIPAFILVEDIGT